MSPTHGCGAKWAGNETCHCAGCHLTFTSLEAFDAHRRHDRDGVHCADPGTLLHKTGKPRFETFTDRGGCVVWRSTKRMATDGITALRRKDLA